MPSPHAIFRQPTPEEAELLLRRAELAAIRATLAAREAKLADLRATLFSFEGRYIRQVGVLYIQLDEWNDRIAELHNPSLATTPSPGTPLASEPTDNQQPTPNNLKALFREVAKRIHPDFAADAADERHRTHLMAQANAAYLRDDAAILLRMLNGYDPSTNSGDTSNTAAELAQTLTQIAHCTAGIASLNAEIEALAQSEMAQLLKRTILAATQGQDLLAKLAAQVKGNIGLAMRRYELDLGRIRRKQAPFNPSPLLSAETPDPPRPRLRHLRIPRA
jgi:hypothetical protein